MSTEGVVLSISASGIGDQGTGFLDFVGVGKHYWETSERTDGRVGIQEGATDRQIGRHRHWLRVAALQQGILRIG